MQTHLAEFIKDTPHGRRADEILRACVHCGFCNATCPTYGLLGDELDGPRGRIYLIKQALEGQEVSAKTQLHLDRCLTCRACETTCPSGVRYGELADIGRAFVDQRVKRRLSDRLARKLLLAVLPKRARFARLVRLGRLAQPILPRRLRRQLAVPGPRGGWPAPRHARRMLLPQGCVQPALAPGINLATARVLDRLGISVHVPPDDGCCGALSQHLTAHEQALAQVRHNVDRWWPYVEGGIEAIVVTASGCGTMIKDYGNLLANDDKYADRAAKIADLAKDLAEVVAAEDLTAGALASPAPRRVAFQSPCTLQHGQRLPGIVEDLLSRLGLELTAVPDGHLCCGAAGTYSLFQPALSRRLLRNKLRALGAGAPEVIATANIGCLTHMQGDSTLPVVHWIELLDRPDRE